MKAEVSKALTEVYLDWADEQARQYQPAAEWATNDPTAYAEHPELLSASPAAEAELHTRQAMALSELQSRGGTIEP